MARYSQCYPSEKLEGVKSVMSLNLTTDRIDNLFMALCSFRSLRQLHMKLDGYPDQQTLATICTNLVNLRELLIDIPFLREENLLDDFCSMHMHQPRAKRYLRLNELFARKKPMKIVSNKEEFIRKYIQLYPTHLKFKEKFKVKE